MNANHPAWTALGWTLVHTLWIGTIIGLSASAARRLMRRSSPESRHSAALLGLIALAIAPFATFAVIYEPPARISIAASTPAMSPVDPVEESPTARSEPLPRLDFPQSQADRSSRIRPWIDALPWAWLSGSTLTMAWLSIGLAGVGRLRRGSIRLTEGPAVELCWKLSDSLSMARQVSLAVSDRVASPLLVGIVRPTILLPASALSGWTPELLEFALLHELAHLRRLDNITCLFQGLVEAFLFFHPTTWWLSSWLRLERETCCDRLVVDRTGRRRSYAEWLASMAGARPLSLAPSLTERPIATRIRRILFMEDRPMSLKPTAPEALALAFAGLLAATLALPSLATQAPPQSKADDDLRRLAVLIADGPDALPDNPGNQPPVDGRIMALIEIANAQAKRGDRAGALKTLDLIEMPPTPEHGDASNYTNAIRIMYRGMVGSARYEAGDAEGGRLLFRQIVDSYDRPDLERDGKMIRALENLLSRIVNKIPKAAEDGSPVLVEIQRVDAEGPPEELADMDEVMAPVELLGELAKGLAERKELPLVRTLVDHGIALTQLIDAPLSAAVLKETLGKALIVAGDEARGRKLIAEARAIVAGMPDGSPKDGARLLLGTIEPSADLDGSVALIRAAAPNHRNRAIRRVLDNLCGIELALWFDAGGIKINIADPGLSLKDKAAAKSYLPKLIDLANTVEDVKERARTLALLARLQAQADDLPGALATAEAMPDLRKADYPGPRDGFYDAVKPATFALIARHRGPSGDNAGADAAFARSAELARAVTDETERIIAWIVLASSYETAKRPEKSAEILALAIPSAQAQPEPRRSRMLSMLAMNQLKVSGVDAATRTADTLRDEPGIEKASVLSSIARQLGDSDQPEAASKVAQRALELIQPKDSDPKPNPRFRGGMTRNGFIDFDTESPAEWLMAWRSNLKPTLGRIAGVEEANLAAMDPRSRYEIQVGRVQEAFRKSGLDAALKAAEAIESPEGRIGVLRTLAVSLPSESVRK